MSSVCQNARQLMAVMSAICALWACAGPSAPSPATVDGLIGHAACTGDSQCRTIGVGARPCGGPDAYLAWSTAATDERALTDAVQREAAARHDANDASGRMSICGVLPDPGAACVATADATQRHCSLRSGTAPATAR